MMRAKKANETSLVRAIIEELNLRGIKCWRANRGAARYPGKDGKTRFVQYGINGQADITGILNDGRRLEIEVKVGNKQPSDAQREFLQMIQQRGGLAIVAWSMSDVDKVMVKEGYYK